ncbi:HNH endonuclease [Pseudonocardia xinjiangensis]|uniref:HNH endonuclease n=1 Tax=Pseudonocardia xinjiangensis TaxID=75289 RepID=UPI003D8D287A
MRFVDTERAEEIIPGEWLRTAAEAISNIDVEEEAEARKNWMRRAAALWQEAKPYLAKVMDGKCWYCETKDSRSDNAVDHFRPKSHYWWLAARFENFRFACTYCNSRRIDREYRTEGGKQDSFPLFDESNRAKSSGDSLDREGPILIDPCKFLDPRLLWFDETGLPSVNPEYETEEVKARVKVSTRLYHLDHAPLVAARRRKFLEVHRRCTVGDAIYKVYEETRDHVELERWSHEVAAVFRLIDRASEYSAAARCALLGLRSRSPTAQAALEC